MYLVRDEVLGRHGDERRGDPNSNSSSNLQLSIEMGLEIEEQGELKD